MMVRARWQPFGPMWSQLNQLQSEMNQLMNRWLGDSGQPVAAYPPVNVWEDAENLYLEAELPGLDLKDIDIEMTGANQLIIKGERRKLVPEQGVPHRQERGYGSFARALTLPTAVDPNNVEAHLEHGVLKVRLAKAAEAKPRKIQVKCE